MRNNTLSAALLALALPASAQSDTITVEAPDTVTVGTAFEITWIVHARTDSLAPLDLGPLFRVGQQRMGNRYSTSNGVITAEERMSCDVMALAPGTWPLPVLHVRIGDRWHASPAGTITATGTFNAVTPDRLESWKLEKAVTPPTGTITLRLSGDAGYLERKDADGGHVLRYLTPEESRIWQAKLDSLAR